MDALGKGKENRKRDEEIENEGEERVGKGVVKRRCIERREEKREKRRV